MMGTVATYFIILLEYGDLISQGAGVQDDDNETEISTLKENSTFPKKNN